MRTFNARKVPRTVGSENPECIHRRRRRGAHVVLGMVQGSRVLLSTSFFVLGERINLELKSILYLTQKQRIMGSGEDCTHMETGSSDSFEMVTGPKCRTFGKELKLEPCISVSRCCLGVECRKSGGSLKKRF